MLSFEGILFFLYHCFWCYGLSWSWDANESWRINKKRIIFIQIKNKKNLHTSESIQKKADDDDYVLIDKHQQQSQNDGKKRICRRPFSLHRAYASPTIGNNKNISLSIFLWKFVREIPFFSSVSFSSILNTEQLCYLRTECRYRCFSFLYFFSSSF